jgi:23S rRNA (guanosine2251-2'-O)-methyltransferase
LKTPEPGRRGSGPRRADRRDQPGPHGQRQQGRTDQQRGPKPPHRKGQAPQRRAPVYNARYLYGRNGVLESLRGRRPAPSRIWIAEGTKPDERFDEIKRLAREAGVPVEDAPRMLLDDMTDRANHQGVVLDPAEYPYVDIDDLIETGGTVLILDHLQDPQNFGALIRAADAVGVGGVVLPQDRSVAVTPAVVNASAGAVEHVQVALVANLNRALEKLEGAGYWIAGLAGEDGATDIFETDLPSPLALIVGSEGRGMSQSVKSRCQLVLRLPMHGHVESLNAATAGTVALYEILRQQRAASA